MNTRPHFLVSLITHFSKSDVDVILSKSSFGVLERNYKLLFTRIETQRKRIYKLERKIKRLTDDSNI